MPALEVNLATISFYSKMLSQHKRISEQVCFQKLKPMENTFQAPTIRNKLGSSYRHGEPYDAVAAKLHHFLDPTLCTAIPQSRGPTIHVRINDTLVTFVILYIPINSGTEDKKSRGQRVDGGGRYLHRRP